MLALLIAGLGATLAYASLRQGAVWPQDSNICLLAVGLLSLIYWLSSRRRSLAPALHPVTRFLLIALLALAVLQVLPLPLALLKLLSPARAELLNAGATLLGRPRFATLSIVPAATFEMVLLLSGYILVFLLVRGLAYRTARRPFATVWPFLLIAALQSALGMLQYYGPGSAELARGTYVNRNHYAGFLEMSLPFPIMYALFTLRRGQKRFESPARPALLACLLLALAALLLLAITHSLSRGGFLATLASLFVMALLAIAPGWPAWKRWLPIAGAALLAILAFLYLPTDQLIARFADIAATEDISSNTRAQIWRDTSLFIAAFPVFGCGLGGYESGFLRYKTVAPMYTVDYAHNDYLQILAEMGLLGFAVLVVLAFRLFTAAVSAASLPAGASERYLGLACCAAFTAILLHSLVDFNLYIPANAMLLSWVGGIAAGLAPLGSAASA